MHDILEARSSRLDLLRVRTCIVLLAYILGKSNFFLCDGHHLLRLLLLLAAIVFFLQDIDNHQIVVYFLYICQGWWLLVRRNGIHPVSDAYAVALRQYAQHIVNHLLQFVLVH